MKPVELRVRRTHGSFRMQLGVPKTRAELSVLEARKKVLARLADRGEWDVLDSIKSGSVSAEQVERLVDQHGIENYRALIILKPKPTLRVPTLSDHVAVWLATVEKPSTREAYRKAMPHLTGYEVDGAKLGDRPWPNVARHTIRDVKASLGYATNTVRLYMGAWSSFFSWAIEREQSQAEEQGRDPIIHANPVQTAKAWSKIERTRHRFLTWAEFEKLLEVAPEPMRAQYAALILGGFRVEEFMTLPPQHVHLPTHIHIGPWDGWAPKGYPRYAHGVRDVPIHRGVLLPLLEAYAEAYPAGATFFVNPTRGTRWTYHSFTDRLRTDVEAAGMVYGQLTSPGRGMKRKRNGVTPHTLRHTLASWLAQDDVQLMKIAAILGDTVETVEVHYAHLLPGDLDQSINRVVGRDPALVDHVEE